MADSSNKVKYKLDLFTVKRFLYNISEAFRLLDHLQESKIQ